ncbi:LPXTG cell wall anchor domain-containing protein [Erythrobacter sp. W53]|uniref:LPXTG cell wall anchor domain-containing protein n=1 Tax=Erythrobacter sp. W53 TaxID=3425947 RepID=UPI003D768326
MTSAVICLFALVSSVWVASHASTEAFTMMGLILLVGTGLYFLAKRTPEASPAPAQPPLD